MKKISLFTVLLALTTIVVSQNSKDTIFFDDFEVYNPGEQLACQNPNDWSTWTNSPCGSEDAYISDMYAYSGTNSVNLITDNDLVYELDNYITNNYCWVTMMIYIPNGNSGYYNVMSDCGGGTSPEWAFEVYFNDTGNGYINAGGEYAEIFDYGFDTWISTELVVDLSNNLAWYFMDYNLVHEWQWTSGAGGNGSQLQLAAIDFFGVSPSTSYYFDDFKVESNSPGCLTKPANLTGPDYVAIGENINISWEFPDLNYNPKYFEYFNIYRDGFVIGTSTELEYIDNINISSNYTYCVTAVYDIGESECSNSITVFVAEQLNPPLNLTGIIDDNDVTLNWDPPSGGNGDPEWIHWDNGENTGNGIGLTSGGTFMVASRWMQNELTAFNGMSITQMSFYAIGDPSATFVLKIWTGFDGSIEVMSQATTFNIDEFNIINLDNPVTINANMQYWFGYEITHNEGSLPAGADDGPAVQGSGDMVSLDGIEWVGMSATYGLDCNWNIAVYVDNGKNVTTPQVIDNTTVNTPSNSTLASIVHNGTLSVFNPEAAKDLTGYNVYRNGEVIGTTDETTYTDYNLEPDTYEYCITAIYDEGESVCSNEWVVDVITGIDENELSNIQIFPNPASDVVNIISDTKISNVKIYGFAGQIILDKKADSKFHQINISQFEAGIYFFRIETEEGIVSERIVVQ